MTQQLKTTVGLLLFFNFCIYALVLGIAGWVMNRAINHGFIIGPGLKLPGHFSPILFAMGNAASGFFVMFSLIAGVVGAASAISGLYHFQHWDSVSLSAAASTATIAWALTVLGMGLGCKEIFLRNRNACLRAVEAFMIILSATQLYYIAAIQLGASRRTT